MVRCFGVDASRWLVLVVVLYIVWTVTSVICRRVLGCLVWAQPPQAAACSHKQPKQHLTLVYGHKVNDNSTYCGVWNRCSGYFSSLHASLQGWLFRSRGGWMREICLGCLMALKWGGNSLVYFQNNHPVWLFGLNVLTVHVHACVCVCMFRCVWMARLRRLVWLMTTAFILSSTSCSRFSIAFTVQRSKLEPIVEGRCSQKI